MHSTIIENIEKKIVFKSSLTRMLAGEGQRGLKRKKELKLKKASKRRTS